MNPPKKLCRKGIQKERGVGRGLGMKLNWGWLRKGMKKRDWKRRRRRRRRQAGRHWGWGLNAAQEGGCEEDLGIRRAGEELGKTNRLFRLNNNQKITKTRKK